ncbi:unnamed protein product [Soboliphyme baturini]|uniref:Vacuolar fusion protein MON1 homolog n=1 Tax=Soboliphyme baturini TaxID=241478 RepID=A0A183J9W4_9BILA|nr:unnamed protein product [Soboliphyme baturini]
MGVIQALCSFVTSMHAFNKLEWIVAGKLKIVFLPKSPLILVAASHTGDSTNQLSLLLIYVYQHILSVLTLSRLTRIFEQRKNFDLRRLLGGTDKIIDNFLNSTETDLSVVLNAFRCHAMPFSLRESIVQTMVQYCAKAKAMVFAVLLFNNRVIALAGRKKSFLNAHISYLGDHCPTCLVLFGIDVSGFFTMSEIKKNILEVILSLSHVSCFDLVLQR